jgi:hypothetical protein
MVGDTGVSCFSIDIILPHGEAKFATANRSLLAGAFGYADFQFTLSLSA